MRYEINKDCSLPRTLKKGGFAVGKISGALYFILEDPYSDVAVYCATVVKGVNSNSEGTHTYEKSRDLIPVDSGQVITIHT